MTLAVERDVKQQVKSFNRLVLSPTTSANKASNSDTQSLINQAISQQLTDIGERFNKIEKKLVKKTSGPHKSKHRSAETKHKVVNQSHSTLTSNNSERTHTNATDRHTVPSTVSPAGTRLEMLLI